MVVRLVIQATKALLEMQVTQDKMVMVVQVVQAVTAELQATQEMQVRPAMQDKMEMVVLGATAVPEAAADQEVQEEYISEDQVALLRVEIAEELEEMAAEAAEEDITILAFL
jgi:hypothetical protein